MKTTVRIMTSNVWGNCPHDAYISNRDDNLGIIYHRYLPHSVGLQEYSPRSRAECENIGVLISDLYTEVPVDTSPDTNNYTPIFYRHDLLERVAQGFFCFDSLNDGRSKSVTWACFSVRATGNRYIHINTHFYWTSDAPGRAARIRNAQEMIALVETLAKRFPGTPMFFTGDFNCCTREAPLVMLGEEGILEARDLNIGEKPVICSHHEYPGKSEDGLSFTVPAATKPGPAESIDHVLVRYGDAPVTVHAHVIVDDVESLLATDHCPIYCDMEF